MANPRDSPMEHSMKYSSSQFTQLVAKYHEAFGPFPEGLLRWCANTGQTDRMGMGMEEALEAGKEPNWDDYVNPSGHTSRPTPAELRLNSKT